MKNISDDKNDTLEKNRRYSVIKKYERFIITFNRYFPHVEKPIIVFDFEFPYFYIKMYIFDTMIGMCKIKRKLFPAINDIMDVGNAFLINYIDRCVTNIDSKEITIMEVNEEKVIQKIKEPSPVKKIGIDELGYVLNSDTLVKEIEEQIKPNKQNVELHNTTVSATIKSSRVIKQNYTELVKEYCLSRRVFFPEYLIEKHNGVYICTGEFKNETFSSIYAYTKEEAKEEVCKKIYDFIMKNIEKINEVEEIMANEDTREYNNKKTKVSKEEEKYSSKREIVGLTYYNQDDSTKNINENSGSTDNREEKNENEEEISGSSPLFVDLNDVISKNKGKTFAAEEIQHENTGRFLKFDDI